MTDIHFAPLQGYTDYIYRNIHQMVFGGIATYYTPFVRIERGEFRKKELRDIDPDNNQTDNLIPQLIASQPDELERIINLLVQKGYKKVDINLGCPFPVLAKKHKGSGILPYADEVYNLLNSIHKYAEISFSIKMRLGWESPKESIILLPFLNELPLSHICIHPRLGKQQYKGEVDMEGFADFYEECKLPLIYNGDIKSVEDIEFITQSYPKLTGIMIGRGLLANPAMAIEYLQGFSMEESEVNNKMKAFHDNLFDVYANTLEGGEKQILQKMKTVWDYFLPDTDKKLKKKILKSRDLKEYKENTSRVFIL